MEPYALIYTGNEADLLSIKALKAIDNVTAKLEAHKSSIIIGNKLHTLGWSDTFRMLVEGLDDCPLVYRNLILNSAYAIHGRYPVAVPLYLITLQQLFRNKSLEKTELQKIIHGLIWSKKRVSSLLVKKTWKRTVQDELTKSNFGMICRAIDEAGALGTIEIRQGKHSKVETHDGISVAAELHPIFCSSVGDRIQLDDCKIVIVDGAILSVGELNRLLTYASESKTSVVIFATKFSDDVLNTLAVNWHTGKLRVVPMLLGDELNDLNQGADLASITSTVFVSKEMGNSITEIDEEDIRGVKSIMVDNIKKKCEIIVNDECLGRVLTLRAEIQTKFLKQEVGDIKDVLSKRLGRLTGRKTTITIACDSEEIGLIRDRAANLFSFVKSCANEGVVEMGGIYQKLSYGKTTHLSQFLPAQSVKLSILKAIADFEQVNKVGALILVDR